ncbi:hypothetical protein JDV02_000698 [Purpureocillium takamizusanense]|uniref:Transcription regulator Rua1 C-terminal domain-containing protein n=1 Tax=Purpureocillium takamizusanense TaxID=2060973 RepID=A0A9Q8V6N4_9HYPO|nr:uncharacterized protein JDV02_000698 [Purpureocillium takamizusanense]UNI14014.1 hypothetical protein JDV02_000698 [Purpureocillium takamizusanense]
MDGEQVEGRQQMRPHSTYYPTSEAHIYSPEPDQSTPMSIMETSSVPTTEAMMSVSPAWLTPPTSQPRQRPESMYQDGMSCCSGDDCTAVQSWNSLSPHPEPEDVRSRPVSVGQEGLPLSITSNDHWTQKPCDGSLDFQGLEVDGPIGQAYTTDEAVPIIDLRYPNVGHDGQPLSIEDGNHRGIAGSSPPTSAAVSDIQSYDDFSTALSEATSYGSDYLSTSNRNSIMSSMQVSPAPSPHMTPGRPEQVRAQSRGRASPSPRPSARSVPYSLDGAKGQRWSTGSYAPGQNRRHSPFVSHGPTEAYNAPQRMSYTEPAPGPFPTHPAAFGNSGYPGAPRTPFMMGGQPLYQGNNMLLPSHLPPQPYHPDMRHLEQPPPLPSQGLFKMLQSNGDPHNLHGHYTDLSEPPDLFASLQEEQIPPPEEDMHPSDADMIPYEQDLRFEGDLYTPRWVRGHGNKREGWCGICKPGRWLVLKNSAFWYDKSFTHGISAATGSPFQEPLETRRMDGNPDVWEGLCGSCNGWIALVSSKKKGTTWFRHAYKCHAHPKVKDVPKRRRETNHGRGMVAQQPARFRPDANRPETPQTGSAPATSGFDMPTSMPMPLAYGQGQFRPQGPLTPVPTPGPLRGPSSRLPVSLSTATAGLTNMI